MQQQGRRQGGSECAAPPGSGCLAGPPVFAHRIADWPAASLRLQFDGEIFFNAGINFFFFRLSWSMKILQSPLPACDKSF